MFPPTLPPPTADAFSQMMAAIEQLTAEVRENNRLLRKENIPWITPDEAAKILGINITAGGYHKRVVRQLTTIGYLAKFTGDRNIRYDREEVCQLVKKEQDDPKFFIPRRILR